MASDSDKVRILMVRSWTEPLAPFRAALRDARIDARITRIDIEPALNAALTRGGFDVIVLDPKMPAITRDLIEIRLREHQRTVPIVMLEDPHCTASAIARALAERLN